MELPQPPQDQELKNIIDKLAQFVARNGPEFEQMTKTKQKDNPKFSFLFGGEYFNYYQYKVTTEQAILKHRQTREGQQGGPHPMSQPPLHSPMRPYGGPQPPQGYPGYYPPVSGYGGEPPPYPQGMMPSAFQHQFPLPPQGQEPPPLPMTSVAQPVVQGPAYVHPSGSSTYPPGEPAYSQSSGYPPPATGDGPFPGVPAGYPPNTSLPEQFSSQPPLVGVDHIVYTNANGYQGPMTPSPSAPAPQPPPAINMEAIAAEQQQLQEQIKQSEQNLLAQQQVIEQQKDVQVMEGIYVARGEVLRKESLEMGLDLQEFEEVLTPIIESCTKDSISNGKQWIFAHASSQKKAEWISSYLLYRSTSVTGPFTHKLHVIYLMNDVLHHCLRKNADDLRDSFLKVLCPMFCYASVVASEDQKQKLNKLLSLWESKMLLDESLVSQLRLPSETWKEFEDELKKEYAQVVATVNQHLDATYEGYQQQHNAFVQHATNQIQQLEQQKQQHLEHQQQQAAAVAAAQAAFPPQTQPPPPSSQQPFIGPGGPQPPVPPSQVGHPGVDFNQPPPGFSQGAQPPSVPVVDFSKPPPGFTAEVQKENIPTSVPYYELPAGLMALLIKDSDNKYKPLNPADLRLPPPTPPSESLLRAVENFYQPPSHERPRNSEGWEQLALYDYYKTKAASIKAREKDVQAGIVQASRSPSPVVIETPPQPVEKVKEKPTRVYRVDKFASGHRRHGFDGSFGEMRMSLRTSRSLTPQKRSYRHSSNWSVSPESEQTRSRSPSQSPDSGYAKGEGGSSRYSRSRSRSPRRRRSRSFSPRRSRSLSRSPPRKSPRMSPRRSLDRSRSHSRSRSRSRSRTPPTHVPFRRSRSRSLTPPSFGTVSFLQGDGQLDESNKGHQMLRNMGWGGSGLGAQEQGISNPIPTGEVRDSPQERFRGLGTPSAQSDPYEAFRKNKGKAFISRMKARAEEKEKY